MSANTSLAGNAAQVSLQDAVFAALGPDGAPARPAADADARHEYTALDSNRSENESGMLGDAQAQTPGQRQAHGAAQSGGASRQGLGQFNHGVLSMAGTVLAHGERQEGGDSGVGHLVLGGAEITEKKPGVLVNARSTDEGWSTLHHDVDLVARIEPVAAGAHQLTPAAASGEEHSWSVVHEIPHPEGVHKIAPIVDSLHEVAASQGFEPQFVSRDGFGDSAAPPAPEPAAAPAEPPAAEASAADAGPSLGGKAEPGARVALYDNGALVDSVDADGDGNWDLSPQLGEGSHHLTAMASDASGHQAVASELTIVVAEQAQPPATSAAPAGADHLNTGLTPGALLGQDQLLDFDFSSLLQPTGGIPAGEHSALSGQPGFVLPDDGQMGRGDAGDSGLLNQDGAGQLLDLGALFTGWQAAAADAHAFTLGLGDVLQQGHAALFADSGVAQAAAGGSAAISLDDLLAGGSHADDWSVAASPDHGVAYDSYLHLSQNLEQLMQPSEN